LVGGFVLGMASRRGLGHVTPTIFGSTIGYPSNSLASCSMIHPSVRQRDRQTDGQPDGRAIAYSALSICCRALKIRGISSKNRNIVSRKSRFGLVQTHMSYFVVSRPKFTGILRFLLPNAGEIVLDQNGEVRKFYRTLWLM